MMLKSIADRLPGFVKVRFWVSVGPLLLLFALAAALTAFASGFALVALIAFAGLLLSWKWHLPGACMAIGALFFLSLWQFGHPGKISFLWHLGLEAAVASALIIAALSQQEIEEIIGLSEKEKQEIEEQLQQALAGLQEMRLAAVKDKRGTEVQIEELQEKVESYRRLFAAAQSELEMLREQNQKRVEESVLQAQANASLRIALEAAEKKASVDTHLLDQLNDVRTDRFQLSLLQDAQQIQSRSREAELESLRADAQTLRTQLEEVLQKPQPDGSKNYDLLKSQFEEKSAVLHATRRELFHMENRLLTLQRENEEKGLSASPEEATLIENLKVMSAESIELHDQVTLLQDLVTTLLKKKRSRPKKQLA